MTQRRQSKESGVVHEDLSEVVPSPRSEVRMVIRPVPGAGGPAGAAAPAPGPVPAWAVPAEADYQDVLCIVAAGLAALVATAGVGRWIGAPERLTLVCSVSAFAAVVVPGLSMLLRPRRTPEGGRLA